MGVEGKQTRHLHTICHGMRMYGSAPRSQLRAEMRLWTDCRAQEGSIYLEDTKTYDMDSSFSTDVATLSLSMARIPVVLPLLTWRKDLCA